MPRLLFLVSSATQMKLADGSAHVTGYFAEEALRPYERFVAAGVDVVVATPDGRAPVPDPYGLQPFFHYPDEDEDFVATVFRSFMANPDDVRITFHQLTELDLIAARRIHEALRAGGSSADAARSAIQSAARTAWSRDRNFIDVLAEDPGVTAYLSPARLREIARDVQRDSAAEAHRVAERLASIEGFRAPRKLADLEDRIEEFDAVFVPGGHGPMVDMAFDPVVGRVLRRLHERSRTIATLCHGPAALLAAGEDTEGKWLFDGYRMTAFSDEEEAGTEAGRLGMAWLLESALKNAGGVFDDAPAAWNSHVVVDRNLITGSNPMSSDAIAEAVLKLLPVPA
jgi:putative intracellular protease/amidase